MHLVLGPKPGHAYVFTSSDIKLGTTDVSGKRTHTPPWYGVSGGPARAKKSWCMLVSDRYMSSTPGGNSF